VAKASLGSSIGLLDGRVMVIIMVESGDKRGRPEIESESNNPPRTRGGELDCICETQGKTVDIAEEAVEQEVDVGWACVTGVESATS